jgi:transposase
MAWLSASSSHESEESEVKTMEEYIHVRRLKYEDGLSIREISRRTGIHRRTIRKILTLGAPPGYQRSQEVRRPVLGPFVPIIDAILEKDKEAPPKQRHTAARIFRRLREEYGYRGGYTQVKAYVREARPRLKEAYVPLSHEPGEAQVDWGEAYVVDHSGRRKVQMFVLTLPFSGARFVAAFPKATLEFFLEGHRRAFAFFGGVPRLMVYDNLRSAVTKVGEGRRRRLNQTFAQFVDYHLITPRFCNVAKANEKGHVEGGVGWARRNLLTPLPHFSPIEGDWERFNQKLAQGCRSIWDHRVRGKAGAIGKRLSQDQAAFLPVPPFPVDEGRPKTWEVSSLCLVRFDTNDYSVPCEYAYHQVLVRADVANVRIFYGDQCIASHARCHEREKAVYEPWHYLTLVERKPRTLDDGAPMKQLDLEPCFAVLRRRMEAGQEHSQGTRAYIRVLQLLKDYSLEALTRAVKRALELHVEDEEAIKNLLLCPPEEIPSPMDLSGRRHLKIPLPAPDLARYASLLAGGAP